MITDLFEMEDRFNVPGIAGDMNWSARLPMTIPQMRTESPYREESVWLKNALIRTQR
jgi:4-alpha-glucanotransferase